LTVAPTDSSGTVTIAETGDFHLQLADRATLTPGTTYVSALDVLGGGADQWGLYRFFGDATGNGLVDPSDLGLFRGAYNAISGTPSYLWFLDADNNGAIDPADLGQFRAHYNGSVFT
jgi:hypothetical protein